MAQLDHSFKKNQAMQAACFLAGEYGFEPVDLGAQGMVKVLDDQHAVEVSLGSKTMSLEKAVDGAADWQVSFSFSRRDLNEHMAKWRGESEKLWFHASTVWIGRNNSVLTDTPLEWKKDEPFEAGRDRIEATVNKAIGMANLEFIEAQLYDSPNKIHVNKCVVNDALNGVDRVWDEYLANHERIMSGPREDVRAKFVSFDEQLRAFKAKFPDGIPR